MLAYVVNTWWKLIGYGHASTQQGRMMDWTASSCIVSCMDNLYKLYDGILAGYTELNRIFCLQDLCTFGFALVF